MNKDEIRQSYKNITSRIESDWSEYHVPADVQHFYLLAELIVIGNFQTFIDRYGHMPIDSDFAEIGKDEYLKLGKLSQFERDTCNIWNHHLDKL